jgi:4-carboxymuconolactone decarboxylase
MRIKKGILIAICLLCSATEMVAQVKKDNKKYNMTSITAKGEPAPKEYFTGNVWVNMAVKPDDHLNSTIGKVTFEPKARTNWHRHPYGQILIVTEGIGYYQEKGKPIQVIKTSDVVKIPVNVEHWHGASHHSAMTHIAIVPSDQNGTIWLKPVTDTEYDKAKSANGDQPKQLKLTEAATKNHEELLPGHISTLQKTDPEFIELFDNFAFDEVLAYGNLDTKMRVLMILGSTIASQALSEYKVMVGGALNVGATPVEIKEVLYQSVPYVGIAKVLDFLHATNDVLQSRGIELPLAGQSTTTRETRQEKGLALQKEINGNKIDEMYKASPPNQLHIQKLLSANCFGDYYTRTGLDIKTRELLTYSMLISLGGVESQVKGHIQANINVGNDKQMLLTVTTQLLPYIGYPRTLNAIKAINEIIPD